MIKIIDGKKPTLDRSAAMNPSLLALNQEWNDFVRDNRYWIEEYNKKRGLITDGPDSLMITKELMAERLKELYDLEMPRSGQYNDLRKRLFSPENLPAYKKELNRMNQIQAPVPYYRNLLLDEDVREEIDFVKSKMDIRSK